MIASIDSAVNDGRTKDDFEATARNVEEIVELRRMIGRSDYYVRILVGRR